MDVFSPCVTYNKDNTYQFFNPRVKPLEEQGHDPANWAKAMEKGYEWGEEIPIGLFLEAERFGRHLRNWNPCSTKAVRWPSANSASAKNSRRR